MAMVGETGPEEARGARSAGRDPDRVLEDVQRGFAVRFPPVDGLLDHEPPAGHRPFADALRQLTIDGFPVDQEEDQLDEEEAHVVRAFLG
jgi:hypothetical protein